jgi:acyl-CoA synthetase (AMP-forming)/AMP-acid ligase II
MEDRLGVRVQTSWGMTELSPMGTLSPPDEPAQASGRPAMGMDLLLTTPAARPARATQRRRPPEGQGPSVARQYFKAPAPALDADGWFDTGDLAIIDDDGALTLAGRSKDLIKSGGEWINPVDIEEIIGADPAVGLVAVIARVDPKWGERPLLVVEPRQGHDGRGRRPAEIAQGQGRGLVDSGPDGAGRGHASGRDGQDRQDAASRGLRAA